MSALIVEIADGVATLTMNQPASRNSFSPEMREAMAEAVPRVARDPDVRVVVLTGAGGVFCAGGDIRAMKERAGKIAPQDTRERMGELYQWVAELIEMDKPLIAAVDGPAFGAGFSLALAADMVLATPRARFLYVIHAHRAGARLRGVLHLASRGRYPACEGIDDDRSRSGCA